MWNDDDDDDDDDNEGESRELECFFSQSVGEFIIPQVRILTAGTLLYGS